MKLILNNFELEISTDEVFTCHPRDIGGTHKDVGKSR